MPPDAPHPGYASAPRRDLSTTVTRAILSLWAREGKWAEVSLAGVSMAPLIPDGSILTVRFGRQGLRRGDVVLYALDTRIIAHRVLKLGRSGPRWGYLKVKGDPVRAGEAAWVAVEDVVGRVVAVRRPDGAVALLNTPAGRLAGRAAAAISGSVGWFESKVRSRMGAGRSLTVTPFLLGLLAPLHRRPRGKVRESGFLLRPEDRFLIAAARVRMTEEDEQRLHHMLRRDVPWECVRAAASSLGLAPLVFRNLSRLDSQSRVPPAVLAALARSAHASGCQMAIQLGAVDAILAALRREGLDPILLKGAALALTLYDQPAMRSMQDIDLLVEEGQVDTALSVLSRLGFRALTSGRSPAFYAAHHHAVPMIAHGGRLIVEIHRGLVPPEEGLHLDPARFMNRAVRVEARGSSYRVLAREDQILHACLHLSYCDRFVGRVRDLMDVHALVDHAPEEVDWGRIVESAQLTEVARSLYSSLDLARRLLGTGVPVEVLNELARSSALDPLAERLLRILARASLFAGGGSDRLLPGASARWFCDTLIKRARWGARLRDLVRLLAEA